MSAGLNSILKATTLWTHSTLRMKSSENIHLQPCTLAIMIHCMMMRCDMLTDLSNRTCYLGKANQLRPISSLSTSAWSMATYRSTCQSTASNKPKSVSSIPCRYFLRSLPNPSDALRSYLDLIYFICKQQPRPSLDCSCSTPTSPTNSTSASTANTHVPPTVISARGFPKKCRISWTILIWCRRHVWYFKGSNLMLSILGIIRYCIRDQGSAGARTLTNYGLRGWWRFWSMYSSNSIKSR